MYVDYTFNMEDGTVLHYNVDFNRPRNSVLNTEDHPAWTELSFHQCPNCPLNSETHSHCPAAIDAESIITGFNEVISCKAVDIQVKTPEREYTKHTDAQTGLRALIGFVMASSECPVLSQMKGMAYFHLPFSSIDETVYRITSSYLLKEYFRFKRTGEAPDLELNALKQHFEELQTLNSHFLERIRAGCEADSNLNALSALFSISSILSLSLEQQIEELSHLFED